MLFLDADGPPLVGARRALGEFPLVTEQQLEIAHVEHGRVGGPCTFDARRDRVGCLSAQVGVDPAEAHVLDVCGLGLDAQRAGIAVTVGLADGVATGRQGGGFLVIHGHAGEGLAHLCSGLQRVRLAVDAFRVDVDETHLHGGERVFHRIGLADILVAVVGRCQPFLLGTPVGVDLRMPDVLAAETEAEGLQAHVFIGDRAGEKDQVSPGDGIAVFFLERPEQPACLVEVAVVRPRVERRKTDIAGAAAATAVGKTVGAGRVPGEADHQAAIVTIVCRPPVLAVGQQRMHVLLQGLDIELFQLIAIAEILAERIGLGVMLVQNFQVERFRPPGHDTAARDGVATVHDGAFSHFVYGVHFRLRSYLR